jgi:cation diffusion facilitator CzcD-associated flavoprotein CzcO
MEERKVAVIGAGPCGLPACKTLDEFGIDYECLEASDSAGGIWNVESGPGGGYRSLQTNTSTGTMSYSDFPFDEGYPTYPNAEQMVRYFQSYAEKFGLGQRIRFGHRVEHAIPLAGGGWRLEFSHGGSREYKAVIVATGQYNFPRRPHDSLHGRFSGEQLHVFDYLDASTPVDCRGKRVVVVGLGSSAAELGAELSNPESLAGCASQVVLSTRSGRWVLPKMVDGIPFDSKAPRPSDRLPAPIRMLPGESGAWALRRMLGKMIRSLSEKHGGAAALGLPEPEIDPWEDRPTMSIDFIPALQAGRIDVRSAIRSFDGSTVHFEDGTRTDADVILYATGYQLDFPYLDNKTLGCDAKELSLYQRISHPTHDDLFFLGCCRVMCSMWPLAEQQSRWVARLLDGAFELPGREDRSRKAIALASSLPVMCNFYVETLRKEAGGF